MRTTSGFEATNFVLACQAIHELLAREPLGHNDRDLIRWSAIDLISKLKLPPIVPSGK